MVSSALGLDGEKPPLATALSVQDASLPGWLNLERGSFSLLEKKQDSALKILKEKNTAVSLQGDTPSQALVALPRPFPRRLSTPQTDKDYFHVAMLCCGFWLAICLRFSGLLSRGTQCEGLSPLTKAC
jgi:hypothetical protein